jgi:hypothetical protein
VGLRLARLLLLHGCWCLLLQWQQLLRHPCFLLLLLFLCQHQQQLVNQFVGCGQVLCSTRV